VKKFSEGRKIIKKLLSLHSEDAYLLFLAAKNAYETGDQKKAIYLICKSLKRDRDNTKGWKLLSKLFDKKTDWHPVTVAADIKKTSRESVEIRYDKKTRDNKSHYAWLTYAMCRALWRFEGGFQNRFPFARWYRPSFEETLFCYRALVFSWGRTKKKHPDASSRELDFLLKLEEKELLPGWVLIHAHKEKISSHNSYLLKRYSKAIDNYFDTYILGERKQSAR